MKKFNPEFTAIDTRNSKTAVMVAEISEGKKILDYGCGTGRNMKYIKENGQAEKIEGCDIKEQLEYNKEKHDIVRGQGMDIFADTEVQKNKYDIVINSHVLNVIEDDAIKQLVVKKIYSALKEGGKAFIEVRTKKDVENAKTKEVHGQGYKIKCKSGYTYQEGISKEKMIALVKNAGFKIIKHTFNASNHIIVLEK